MQVWRNFYFDHCLNLTRRPDCPQKCWRHQEKPTVRCHSHCSHAELHGVLYNCNCRLKCSDKFTSSETDDLFNSFFALSSEAQKVLLTSCFKSFQPKVVSSGAFRHRKLSFQYFVKSGMPNHQVCKTALKALFQVTKGKLDCIAKRIMQGSQNVPSQQGRHMNRPNRISATTRQQVMDHIKLYPTESSHYSRSRNPHTARF